MAGLRRMRLPALLLVLFILVLVYITTGKRATYASPFYTRTVTAMQGRQDADAQADKLASEKARQDRVSRLQDEHDIAMGKTDGEKLRTADAAIETDAVDIIGSEDGQRTVAGRKFMKDGRVVVDETGRAADGVAKVGNVQAKMPLESAVKDTDDELKAEAEINDILKKGPIIIFSKTRCPYSKNAKNILQNLYTIVPPPYVVELDTHPMGALLQASLGKSTGRRTVPNILVNGKSIGGGDDIHALHTDGKLIDTIRDLGGKRIVEIKPADPDVAAEAAADPKRPVRLRA